MVLVVLVAHILVLCRNFGGNDFTVIPAGAFDNFSTLQIL